MVFVPLMLTMVVASIPIGLMVDKVGRKIPLVLGLGTIAGATVIFVTGTLVTVMVSMVMFGIAQLLVMSALWALSTDLVGSSNRGKVNGFTNFVGYIVMGFGMLIGEFLFIQGLQIGVPQLPFLVALVLTVPELLLVFFLVHEPKKRASMIDESPSEDS